MAFDAGSAVNLLILVLVIIIIVILIFKLLGHGSFVDLYPHVQQLAAQYGGSTAPLL